MRTHEKPDANDMLSRSQKPEARKNNARAEFDDWYDAYPHKVGRAAAEQAFIKARRKADLQTLLDGLARYKREKPADRNWCNPATWLNQDRWLDAPAGTGPPGKPHLTYRPPPNLVPADDLKQTGTG